jgi:MFS family permease
MRTRIFVFFLLANLFLNYDTGVIPASLLEMTKEIEMDYKEQALIGSLVYLGLSFASLFVTLFFNRFGPAKVMAAVLILNTCCCFIFSFSDNKPILFSTRFFMGVSEAFIVIYGPVWVNNYAPQEHSAKWMGILHSCTALGVICGYVIAGVIINLLHSSWRFAIQIQGLAQIPIALYFYFEKEEYINVEIQESQEPINNTNRPEINDTVNSVNQMSLTPGTIRSPDKNEQNNSPNRNRADGLRSHTITGPYNTFGVNNQQFQSNISNVSNPAQQFNSNVVYPRDHQRDMSIPPSMPGRHPTIKRTKSGVIVRLSKRTPRIDTIETNNLKKYCSQAYVVLCNSLYISVTLGLCSMYFIVTGIQFWMTSYLIDILHCDPVQVVVIFSTVSITAPLAGVIIGGTFADKYGGYKGKNTLKALKLCCAFGVVAFVFAFPLGFLENLIYITVLLWTFLFFGAAIVPVGTGIMVSSVRK